MSETDKPDQTSEQDEPNLTSALGNTIRGFLPDPDADAAAGRDVADDASGDEVPQDGDPGR